MASSSPMVIGAISFAPACGTVTSVSAAPRASWRLGELAALGAQWVARSLESALSLSASALLALLASIASALVARRAIF